MPSPSEDVLLLDTHVWVWFLEDHARLKASRATKSVERAAAESRVRVSIMSVWEVAMLESRGRLALPVPVMEWIRQGLSAPGTSLAPLTEEIAVDSTRLPGSFHGDPADRILVATARSERATLVTSDRLILAYAEQKHVRALAF